MHTNETERPPNPYDLPSSESVGQCSVGEAFADWFQSITGWGALAMSGVWLGCLAWEIAFHEIPVDGYFSGFLGWAIVLLIIRNVYSRSR